MQIRNIFKSKATIGALILAVGLWVYTSFSDKYLYTLQIPLQVELPPNRAIEDPLPKNVDVEVFTDGWKLFQLLFFNSSARAYVNLSRYNIVKDTFVLNKEEVKNSIRNINNVDVRNISIQNIRIVTGSVVSKLVKIRPVVRIETKEGFIVVGDIKVNPDTVEITGNTEILAAIQNWFTKKAVFKDVNQPFTAVIPLSDSLSNIINFDVRQVEISANIQERADLVVPDVEVSVRGGLMPVTSELYPETVNVYYAGGVNELADFKMEDVFVYVDYKDLINDSTGIIPLQVSSPKGIKSVRLLKVDPPYIYHNKKDRIIRTRIF